MSGKLNGFTWLGGVLTAFFLSLGMLAFSPAPTAAGATCADIHDWQEDDIFNDDEWHSAEDQAPSGGDPGGGEGEWSIVETWEDRYEPHWSFVPGYMHDPYWHGPCSQATVNCPGAS